MLSLAPAPFRRCSSHAKVWTQRAASSGLACDPRPIHQHGPPYQTGAPASTGGVHIWSGGLLRYVACFKIRSQRQDPEIIISGYKSILRKIRPHAYASCAQVLFWSISLFTDIAEKAVPREAETIHQMGCICPSDGVQGSLGQCHRMTCIPLRSGAMLMMPRKTRLR